MRLVLASILLLITIHTSCVAETTPISKVLKEEILTELTCHYASSEPKVLNKIKYTPAAGTYHYQVYLPAGYYKNKVKRYPSLFVCPPKNKANLLGLKEWTRSHQWVIILIEETGDDNTNESLGTFIAAHDDAFKRFRLLDNFKFATGFSGGARMTTIWPIWRKGFAGIVLQGAGFWWNKNYYCYQSVKENKDLIVYGLFGKHGDNHSEIKWLTKWMPKHTQYKISTFDGGHEWAPEKEMTLALNWVLEASLLKSQVTNKNKDFIQSHIEKIMMKTQMQTDSFVKFECQNKLLTFFNNNTATELTYSNDAKSKLIKSNLEMASVPEIKYEIEAKNKYADLHKIENATRSKAKSKIELQKPLNKLYTKYLLVEKSFPNTLYGKKAKAKAIKIKHEIK